MYTTVDDVATAHESLSQMETRAKELIQQRREKEAISLIGEIVTAREKRGAKALGTTIWIEQMAFCLRKIGQRETSALLFERAYKFYEERLGARHPATTFAHRQVAFALASCSDFERAVDALKIAAGNSTEMLGLSCVATATCYSRMLECLRKLERWSEVAEIGRAYLADCRDSKADDWREQLISILRSISHAYRKLGDCEQAVAFLEPAVHYGRLQWGEADSRVMRDLRWLSRCYLYKGDLSRSLELLQHVLMVHTSTHGASHLSTLAVERELRNRRVKVQKRLGYARRKAQKQ